MNSLKLTISLLWPVVHCLWPDVGDSHYDAQMLLGASERYANEIKGIFLRFGEGIGKKPIHKILPRQLQRFISTADIARQN